MSPATPAKTLVSARPPRWLPSAGGTRVRASVHVAGSFRAWEYLVSERFVEQRLLAVGGMNIVVRAFDRVLQRLVAIKLPLPDLEADEVALARLAEEARITAHLDHDHVPPIYELGIDDRGVRFLCMKLVDGDSLDVVLRALGPAHLETPRLVRLLKVFCEVCDTVSFAHERGVLHRDLKPANVLVGAGDRAYVIDWGVARQLPPGPDAEVDALLNPQEVVIGTPRYMAPEQLAARLDRVTERTDVFGLGAILRDILCAQRTRDPRRAGPAGPPVPGSDPALVLELARIAERALEPDPADRYPAVAFLARDVQSAVRAWTAPDGRRNQPFRS